MQAVADPPPAAQQPPPQNPSYQSSERSTGSHASDHQHSGSGSRLSSEPDSPPGSRERHVNGAAHDRGLLNLAAAAEQGTATPLAPVQLSAEQHAWQAGTYRL